MAPGHGVQHSGAWRGNQWLSCHTQRWPRENWHTLSDQARIATADKYPLGCKGPRPPPAYSATFETPLDILCVYQTAWNPHKSTLKGDKIAMLMKQRQRTWTGIDQWIRSVPQRNG